MIKGPESAPRIAAELGDLPRALVEGKE